MKYPCSCFTPCPWRIFSGLTNCRHCWIPYDGAEVRWKKQFISQILHAQCHFLFRFYFYFLIETRLLSMPGRPRVVQVSRIYWYTTGHFRSFITAEFARHDAIQYMTARVKSSCVQLRVTGHQSRPTPKSLTCRLLRLSHLSYSFPSFHLSLPRTRERN